MGRKKKVKLDKLSLDMIQCEKDGYGVHYGAWRAAQDAKKVLSPPQAECKQPEGYRHICQKCGKEFYTQNKKPRKFCSDQCREASYYKPKPKAKEPVKKTCPICGKDFMAETYRTKYCSPFCVKVAMGEATKRYQAKMAASAALNRGVESA